MSLNSTVATIVGLSETVFTADRISRNQGCKVFARAAADAVEIAAIAALSANWTMDWAAPRQYSKIADEMDVLGNQLCVICNTVGVIVNAIEIDDTEINTRLQWSRLTIDRIVYDHEVRRSELAIAQLRFDLFEQLPHVNADDDAGVDRGDETETCAAYESDDE